MSKLRFFQVNKKTEAVKEETRDQRCVRMSEELLNGNEITIPSFDVNHSNDFNAFIEDIGTMFDMANQNASHDEKTNC